MTPTVFDEQAFIEAATAGGAGGLPVGPGDDAAILPDGTVLAVDAIVEGTHFDSGTPMDLVARKALGACLSDLAAMGARAETVLVAVQLPPGCDARGLAEALASWARRFEVCLAGGDTVAAPPGALALSVTASGHCDGPPWLRSGGRPGDQLVVTGPLGGSRAGRHLRVAPRSDVVRQLRAAGATVHACMDLSDGLATDLPRLCAASAVGARVLADCLPVHADVAPGRDGPLAALGDGEDFELLLALPAGAALPPGMTRIGELLPASAGLSLQAGGSSQRWPRLGYAHAF